MQNLKKQAINYRKRGFSYNMIGQEIGVSKSTLSDWLSKIPFSPNKKVIKRISLARQKSSLFKHTQKMREITIMKDVAEKELGKITGRDLWLLGIGLYSGEGSKSGEQVRFANSDPEMIKIAMMWFRKVCHLENKNINPFVHIYPDNNVKKTLNYWSKITRIPKKQFGKTYIDRRTNKLQAKRKTLPYGTLHLRIKSCGEKEFGRRLHRRIMGWIGSAVKQINAGIV